MVLRFDEASLMICSFATIQMMYVRLPISKGIACSQSFYLALKRANEFK